MKWKTDLIVSSLKNLQKRRRERVCLDEAGHFAPSNCSHPTPIYTTANALAKLQIEQMLFNIEFPVETSLQSTSTP